MNIKLTWRGEELKREIERSLPDALFDAALTIVETAAARAPVDTGELRDSGYAASETKSTYIQRRKSYRKEIRPRRGQAIAAFAAHYAHFIEYGSGKQPARPFLRPAVDERLSQIGNDIALAVRDKVFR